MNEQIQSALNKAYFFLKFRSRTKKEVEIYLKKKAERFHWDRGVVDGAIAQLEEQGLIDDVKFIEWFVDQRNRAKPKSKFVLQAELQRLGVSKDLVDSYFTDSPQDEDALALEALRPKWYKFQSLPKRERFQKIVSFLSRRGFSFDSIKKAIQTIEET